MRTILIRSLQALVSISAVALLTGANDPGCVPSSDGGTAGGTTGTSSGGTAGGSTGTAVACPDGSVAQWVCGDPGMQPPPPMGSGSADPMQPPPPMGDAGMGCPPPPPPCDPTTGAMCPPAPGCVLQCVPMGDVCPTGFHQETVCSDPPPPPPPMDAGAAVPPAPSMGPGSAGGTMGDPSTGNCTTACVPDDACPPGTVQVTVCSGGAPSDPMDPNTPPPGTQMCWNECQPADPSQPPPQMP